MCYLRRSLKSCQNKIDILSDMIKFILCTYPLSMNSVRIFDKKQQNMNPLFLLWQKKILSEVAIFHIVIMANTDNMGRKK